MNLIVLTGLPGSGKTTYRNSLPPHLLFCPDNHLYTGEGKYFWSPERSGRAWAMEYFRLGKWLTGKFAGDPEATHNGVFDATLVNAEKRAPILHIAKGAGCRVTSVFLDTPLDVCRQRNDQRPPDRRVPDKTMEFMFRNLRLPDATEGFDELVVVSYLSPKTVAA